MYKGIWVTLTKSAQKYPSNANYYQIFIFRSRKMKQILSCVKMSEIYCAVKIKHKKIKETLKISQNMSKKAKKWRCRILLHPSHSTYLHHHSTQEGDMATKLFRVVQYVTYIICTKFYVDSVKDVESIIVNRRGALRPSRARHNPSRVMGVT